MFLTWPAAVTRVGGTWREAANSRAHGIIGAPRRRGRPNLSPWRGPSARLHRGGRVEPPQGIVVLEAPRWPSPRQMGSGKRCAPRSTSAAAARIALAGGTTPREVYVALAAGVPRRRLSWVWVDVFFGDERAVPPQDERSNYRLASETLLSKVAVPPTQVHRNGGRAAGPRGGRGGVTRASCRWRLDVVLLARHGPDGHTASLFVPARPRWGRRRGAWWACSTRPSRRRGGSRSRRP